MFDQAFAEVSNPYHDRYGQYLSRDEIKAMLRPAEDATNAVLSWLQQSGISELDIENKGEWIYFTASIAQAEEMMGSTFELYLPTHADDFMPLVRTLEYSLPKNIFEYVDMIQPTTRFGQIKPQVSTINRKGRRRSANSSAAR